MKVIDIKIEDKTYPMCFSTWAAQRISARYGGLENIDKAFGGETTDDMLSETIFLLCTLIEAGCKYKKVIEGKEEEPLTIEEASYIVSLDDMAGLKNSILDAMTIGAQREVETEPSKNTETTRNK